jgi:hypothetical protein
MKKSTILLIAAAVAGASVLSTAITWQILQQQHSHGTASNPQTSIATPAGYIQVASSDYGCTLTTEKPSADTAHAALTAAFQDLAGCFDAHPTIGGAYNDSRESRNGGASFTALLHGQPMKGFISCKAAAQGTSITVIYCKADTPSDELKKLTQPSAGASGSAASPPAVALNPYQFPDGTGSIGLPEGWQTSASSCNGLVVVQGPANQEIYINFAVPVSTPDSPNVQALQQAQAMGMPMPQSTTYISQWDNPAQVLTNLTPQFNQASQAAGQPTYRINQVVSSEQARPYMQGGVAATVVSDVTQIDPSGAESHRQRCSRIELDPMMQGSFLYSTVDLEAPSDTFDKDIPVMLAICASLKPNYAVMDAQSRQRIDAQNSWFSAEQYAHNTVVAANNEYIQDQDHNANIRDRSFADADEEIIYQRTMLDTQTGERTSENLGDIDTIVDKLNENDPGRFVEIPLRDELYPTDGH